ncbi:MAG: hypothetical protein HY080_14875 [Gammaproteobacteria bacterium]|nr:hypothetical protein [Gammaproteobacteria bacterium]
MNFDLAFYLSIAAIVVMLYCLGLVMSLKRAVPGGMIGKQWSILQFLVVLFTLGYFATPFAALLPEALLRLIVAFIFFFGAVYVVVTVKLIHRVIKVLSA